MILYFSHAEKGLTVADKDGLAEPRETPNAGRAYFEVTDSFGKWHLAKATMDDRKVVVTCDEVTSPIVVQYVYAINPENYTLYNRDGLPASPLCSRPEFLNYASKLPEQASTTLPSDKSASVFTVLGNSLIGRIDDGTPRITNSQFIDMGRRLSTQRESN